MSGPASVQGNRSVSRPLASLHLQSPRCPVRWYIHREKRADVLGLLFSWLLAVKVPGGWPSWGLRVSLPTGPSFQQVVLSQHGRRVSGGGRPSGCEAGQSGPCRAECRRRERPGQTLPLPPARGELLCSSPIPASVSHVLVGTGARGR